MRRKAEETQIRASNAAGINPWNESFGLLAEHSGKKWCPIPAVLE
jgi:hypothetical protein